MRHTRLSLQRGQSLPIVALMLAVIFLIIGLGIDGGLMYSQRRLMQNTADAACLAAANELALGNTNVDAQAAAEAVVQQNLGPTGAGTGANAPGTLSYAAIADVYAPKVGSGASLTRGMEIGVDTAGTGPGPEVRVALTSPAFSYFMRVFAQPEYTVAARSRCDATAGGGGTPFAVARWRRYTGSQYDKVDYDLTTSLSIVQQLASGGKGKGGKTSTDVVRDILGAYKAGPIANDTSVVAEWPAWGTNNYPGNPTAETGLFSQPSTPATTAKPGFKTIIAGNGSTPNRGGASFRGAVLLDLRNVTFPNPEFYSGLDPESGANTYKDFVTRDILQGYNGPWIEPGTQLGFTDGVSAGQIERQFDMRYDEGEIVSVLIYNGTIYFKTDFTATTPSGMSTLRERTTVANFTGDFPEDCDVSEIADAYIFDGDANGVMLKSLGRDTSENFGLHLSPEEENGKGTPDPIDVSVRAFASVDGDQWNQLQAQWASSDKETGWIGFDAAGRPTGTDNFGIASAGETLRVRLRQSETGTCEYFDPDLPPSPLGPTEPNNFISDFPVKPQQGAMSVYLEARDTQTGLRRGQYVRANLGVAPADEDDYFYAYLPGEVSYAPVELDTNKTIQLNQPMVFERVDGTLLTRSDVSVSFDWFNGSLNPTSAPTGISAAVNDVSGSPTLQIGVGSNATSGRDYYLRVAVTYKGKTQWVWYYLAVQPPMSNSKNISEYVYTLGYALFRITDIKSNAIEGEAVSGLLRPGDLIAGRLPRLVPWEE